MANVIPFRGVLYDPTSVGNIADVVSPPYDVIDGAAQAALHARHPHNVIRLELGEDLPGDGPSRNRYTRAADFFQTWLKTGVLRRDPAPSVYPYQIEYRPPAGEADAGPLTLKGLLTTVELAEFGTGRIYPHENTRSAAKADRLQLMETCRANFSPIWSLFSDPAGGILRVIDQSVNADKPRFDFTDDVGNRQRLWAVTDRTILQDLAAAMRDRPLFIADGHHRYETALAYQRLRRQQAGAAGALQPYDTVLMLLGSLEDPGLTVLPTHRVLKTALPSLDMIKARLQEDFKIEEFPFQAGTEAERRKEFLKILRSRGQSRHAFGLALEGAPAYVLLTMRSVHRIAGDSPKDRLDVSILHNQVLAPLWSSKAAEPDIVYTKDDHEALDLIRQGQARAALLLNPTKITEVQEIASVGARMPHKSTYFYPKPLTGLVINQLD
jgi:uncharacterized protein (DUF1015 family)